MSFLNKPLSSVLALLFPVFAFAQDGAPDLSFGNGGAFTINSADESFYAVQIGQQADGKTILAYNNDFNYKVSVLRLTTDGQQDLSFGTGGNVDVNPDNDATDDLYVTRVTPDNKTFLVINSYDYGVANAYDATLFVRLNANGSLDNGFGQNGSVLHDISPGTLEEYFTDAVVLSNGKMLVAGYIFTANDDGRSVLVRLNADGSLDNSYGTNGVLELEPDGAFHAAFRLTTLNDGKLLVAGLTAENFSSASLYFARLDAEGDLDPSYGQNGYTYPALEGGLYVYDLALTNDGTAVYVAGEDYDENAGTTKAWVAKFNLDGTAGTDFGQGGLVVFNNGASDANGQQVEVQFDGKVVFSASTFEPTGFFTARFEPDGNLDPTFGNQGGVVAVTGVDYASVDGMLLQDDGKILVSGYVESFSGNNTAFVRRMLCASCASNAGEPVALVSSINISPNPASEVVQLQFEVPAETALAIQLVGIDGKLAAVLQAETAWAAGSHQATFPLPAGLAAGIYQLVLVSEKGIQAMPLMVR